MKDVIKRILKKDLKSIENLKKNNIFLEFDETNILRAKALIIGPENTLYEGSLLFFNIEFPNNYPHVPPILHYISRNKIRIHPNIYANGKVCLSILGTWSGPSWTSSMDISCVLLSLQSLLNDSPLNEEPGFEKYNGPLIDQYNSAMEFNNIYSLFYRNTKYIPDNFIIFQNEIYKNYNKYKLKNIEKINKKEKKKYNISMNIYKINIDIDYDILLNKLNKFDI